MLQASAATLGGRYRPAGDAFLGDLARAWTAPVGHHRADAINSSARVGMVGGQAARDMFNPALLARPPAWPPLPLWPNRPAGAHRYEGAGACAPTPAPLLAECGSAWATDHRDQP